MHASVLRSLEFDRIRVALARLALTPLGRTRAQALEPLVDRGEIEARLNLTAAAVAFMADGGSLAISAPEDLPTILDLIDVEDQALDPLALRGLARFLASVEAVAGRAGRGSAALRDITETAASFAVEVAAVERAIDPSGDVNDRASQALHDIREGLRRQRARLRQSLDTLTRGRETAKYLQDQIVTDRNGRYVVVVRAEHRDAIPGIVHGSSASGASLYLEPLSTVSLNNDVVTLVEKEKAEIHRILLALTSSFRVRGDELAATVHVAADLDELFAMGSLAQRVDGIAPALTDDGRVEFRGARHPLLIPAIRDLTIDDEATRAPGRQAAQNPVASDLLVLPPARALVISGPNTGGKTVALKAFGLLALMAQAGLLIPVEPGSRFTPFLEVFADIGDEQSIAASLSTFSAHITNIVSMHESLRLPALVLLDEVGSGTDPVEGGALGAAIVDCFRRRGAIVVATTHDDTMKSYAATTDGVVTAGFGFNPDSFAPTYRIVYGAPGRSLALEIAERLGMPAEVVVDARSRRSTHQSQLAAHLARMDQELAALERDRQAAAADRLSIAAEHRHVLEREARLAEREAILKKRLDDRLNEKLRDARAEVDRIVGNLKSKAEVLVKQVEQQPTAGRARLSTGDVGSMRAEARAALGAIGEAVGAVGGVNAADAPLDKPPSVGDVVQVAPFGAQGIVRAVSSKHVDVEVRGKRMRVALGDLRAAGVGREAPKDVRNSRVAAVTGPSASAEPSSSLVLVGATVDEALDRAEKFLDTALLNDEKRVRVVHGHGTGRLREALTKFFREHPLVASVGTASERDGGAAATIVELKE